MGSGRLLGGVCFALAALLTLNTALGPNAAGVIEYHLGETLLNQTRGLELASLIIVAPLAVAAGLLAWRGHGGAPLLAVGPGVYTVYMYIQYIGGQDYLRDPGNAQRFFPLHLAILVTGGATAVLGWNLTTPAALPAMSRRATKTWAAVLTGLAAFLVLFMYPPSLADAFRDNPTRAEYLDDPAMFWMIAMLDLGFAAPLSAAAGVGMLRGREWARRLLYAIVGWYALTGLAVASMAITMRLRDDPVSTVANMSAMVTFGCVFAVLASVLYAPLLGLRLPRAHRPGAHLPHAGGA